MLKRNRVLHGLVGGGDHQGLAYRDVCSTQLVDALNCLLKQPGGTRQNQKLLREPCARQMPQACARTAAEDDRNNLMHG
jgi:hypothetical protein